MTTRLAVGIVVFGLFAAVPAGTAQQPTQQIASAAQRGPRFLVASARGNVPLDVTRTPMLARRISLDLDEVTRKQALTEIARQAGLKLVYGDDLLGMGARVRLRAEGITVAAALTDVLWDVGLDVVFSTNQQAALVRRPRGTAPLPTGEIVGRITDGKTGQGVPSAEVWLERTHWRTGTDTSGWYRLGKVDSGSYTLTVRRLGYAKQSQPVTVQEGRTDTVDVALEPVATRLDELVTTATGRQRRLEIANDITLLNADSIVRTEPIRSLTDLLEARVPGLVVQRTSGAPGDPARLRLRGASSPLLNNDPIVIVDGVRVYAEQSADRSRNLAGQASTNGFYYAAPSPLDYIDPNTIETIEVVKGPSAATLYGQDAANGVIVITTKKGQAGPTRWTASVDHGRTQMEGRYPDLLLRWGHLIDNDAPVPCPIINVSNLDVAGGADCQGDSTVTSQLLSDPALTMLDQGNRTSGTLGVSGGTSVLTYNLTGSYQHELGLIKLPTYEAERYQERVGVSPPDWMIRPQHLTQWGVQSHITARLGSRAEVSLSTAFSRTGQQRSSLEGNLATMMSTFLNQSTETYYTYLGAYYPNSVTASASDQVLQSYFQRATATAQQLTNALNLNWRPHPWLTLTADAGLNIDQRADEIFMPNGASSAFDSAGMLNTGRGTSLVGTVNLRGNAQAPLPHGLRFLFAVGANYTGTSINDETIASTQLAPGTSLLGTKINSASRNVTDDATFGWYAEPSLAHRLFSFSAGLRLDGGSRYGSSVSLPTFPKLGFSYLVSDAPFFPLKDLFQSLRLRVAYGRSSRQPGPADRLRLYGITKQVWSDGGYVPGVYLDKLGNTDLRPERSTEFEGGFDADLWNSRLTVTLTGYRKTTDDAILDVPLPPSVYGGTSIQKNIGVVRNTGVEMTVGAQLVQTGALTWGAQLAVSQNRNLVVRLAPGVEPFYVEGPGTVSGGSRVAAGYPLFGRWSQPVLGYADGNGDGVLQPEEILLGDTAVYVGQTLPNYTANLHSTVSLWSGDVSVTAGFLYEDGLSQYNTAAINSRPFTAGWNDPTASLAEQLTVTSLPNNGYNDMQTVSTLRFNDLAVSYRVPTTFARRIGAQTLNVAVQGSNLGLWTNYRGLDPGVNAYATGNSLRDSGVLPQPRTWQVRLSATY